jgi:hypothetical protein
MILRPPVTGIIVAAALQIHVLFVPMEQLFVLQTPAAVAPPRYQKSLVMIVKTYVAVTINIIVRIKAAANHVFRALSAPAVNASATLNLPVAWEPKPGGFGTRPQKHADLAGILTTLRLMGVVTRHGEGKAVRHLMFVVTMGAVISTTMSCVPFN